MADEKVNKKAEKQTYGSRQAAVEFLKGNLSAEALFATASASVKTQKVKRTAFIPRRCSPEGGG